MIRNGEEIASALAIASLRHFKDDVREVATGLEGGLAAEGFSDFEEGDTIEGYQSERVR